MESKMGAKRKCLWTHNICWLILDKQHFRILDTIKRTWHDLHLFAIRWMLSKTGNTCQRRKVLNEIYLTEKLFSIGFDIFRNFISSMLYRFTVKWISFHENKKRMQFLWKNLPCLSTHFSIAVWIRAEWYMICIHTDWQAAKLNTKSKWTFSSDNRLQWLLQSSFRSLLFFQC